MYIYIYIYIYIPKRTSPWRTLVSSRTTKLRCSNGVCKAQARMPFR